MGSRVALRDLLFLSLPCILLLDFVFTVLVLALCLELFLAGVALERNLGISEISIFQVIK